MKSDARPTDLSDDGIGDTFVSVKAVSRKRYEGLMHDGAQRALFVLDGGHDEEPQTRNEQLTHGPNAGPVDQKLEVVVIPVSDVDRAKRFYKGLRWRLDAEFANGDDWRLVPEHPHRWIWWGQQPTAELGAAQSGDRYQSLMDPTLPVTHPLCPIGM